MVSKLFRECVRQSHNHTFLASRTGPLTSPPFVLVKMRYLFRGIQSRQTTEETFSLEMIP